MSNDYAEEPECETNDGGGISIGEYLALWGHDGDRDGFAFYNYSSEGDDPKYLEEDLLPAIERLLAQSRRDDERLNMPDPDRRNLETVKAYVEWKIGKLRAGGKPPEACKEAETIKFRGRKLTYTQIRKWASPNGRPALIVPSPEQVDYLGRLLSGIDGRLQACMVPERGDRAMPAGFSLSPELPPTDAGFSLSPESLPVALRRMVECPNRDVRDMALRMLDRQSKTRLKEGPNG